MNRTTPFISFDLQQPINQWLCIALISLMCFFVVLYYLVHSTEAFADNVSTINISNNRSAFK